VIFVMRLSQQTHQHIMYKKCGIICCSDGVVDAV